ncbi:putative small-subunit processome, Utp13 protein [Helianthus anomalus]
MLATCGSDAVINIWHDSTAADKEDAYWKEQKIYRSVDAKNQVKTTLGVLSMNKYRLLLEYVREWNTKPKLCHIAQFVLFRFSMKGIGELLEGLVLYSQRHYIKIDRLERSTFLLDYTLNGMSIVEPETGVVDDPKDESLMEVVGQGQEPAGEEDDLKKRSSKKRKSHKLNGGNKKIKG